MACPTAHLRAPCGQHNREVVFLIFVSGSTSSPIELLYSRASMLARLSYLDRWFLNRPGTFCLCFTTDDVADALPYSRAARRAEMLFEENAPITFLGIFQGIVRRSARVHFELHTPKLEAVLLPVPRTAQIVKPRQEQPDFVLLDVARRCFSLPSRSRVQPVPSN